MKILIAPDKFKGSLSACEATAAIRRGFERIVPESTCLGFPVADGGEGTAEIFYSEVGGNWDAGAVLKESAAHFAATRLFQVVRPLKTA